MNIFYVGMLLQVYSNFPSINLQFELKTVNYLLSEIVQLRWFAYQLAIIDENEEGHVQDKKKEEEERKNQPKKTVFTHDRLNKYEPLFNLHIITCHV